MSSPLRSTLRCESLESRETPSAAPLIADSFDAITTPYLPPTAWRTHASNGQEYYGVGRSVALSGTQSMAVYGNIGVTSYNWSPTPAPADAAVSAAVRGPVPAPIQLFTRGRDLTTATPSYLAVALNRSGSVELREVRNGDARVVQRVSPQPSVAGIGWLRISLTAQRDVAEVRVQRTSDGLYLSAAGRWEVAPTTAIRATGLAPAVGTTGLAGVGRLPGPYGTAFVDDFAVTPAAPTGLPEIPRHYSHIRVAQLAYSGTPVGNTERALLRDSVDLVVSSTTLMGAIDQTAPGTPQLVYSNVSNLYGGLLADWLAFADRTGADREAAFYHVAKATAFQGGSPSSQPVTYFWGAYRGSVAGGPLTDLTPHARGGRTTGVTFGAGGEAVSIGFTDRFREINVAITKAADPGWSAGWEYVCAVDGNGVPTAWKPLTILSDATAGLRTPGRLQFDPPADWKAAALPGTSTHLFYVRARTLTGTTAQAPVARTILGRDYVGANGEPRGTIPAFDTAADRDGDGYLNDVEYAARQTGFDARFVHESRLFYPFYGQMRFATNPAPTAVRDWAGDFHARLLAATPLADGVFLDNANGKPPLGGASVREPAGATHPQNAAGLVKAVAAAVFPKFVTANTAGARAEADPTAGASAVAFEEFLLRPMEATWSQVGDAADIVRRRLSSADPSPYVVLDTHPAGGSATSPRTQLGALAYYYLLADPDKTFVMFFGGFSPAAAWSQKWVPAAAADVGRPTGALTTFATGTDPQNAALTYKVFGREYGNALVLFKPRSYLLGRGTGTTQDATATTHQLGGSYRAVNADRTLGPVVMSVTLRNGEGAVLMKA